MDDGAVSLFEVADRHGIPRDELLSDYSREGYEFGIAIIDGRKVALAPADKVAEYLYFKLGEEISRKLGISESRARFSTNCRETPLEALIAAAIGEDETEMFRRGLL